MHNCLQKDSHKNGETIVEYVLMLALIYLIAMFANSTVGERASTVFGQVSNSFFGLVR